METRESVMVGSSTSAMVGAGRGEEGRWECDREVGRWGCDREEGRWECDREVGRWGGGEVGV